MSADTGASSAPAARPDAAGDAPGVDASRIHNFDQRAPIVELRHPALPRGGALRLEQRGATSEGFVSGTSSVMWPVAQRFARHLCSRPELVRGLKVLELGAGVGLVGAAAAAMGAELVVITDCEVAMPLLERNRARLVEDGFANVEVARVEWGSAGDHESVLKRVPGGFDLIVASDVIVGGFDTDKLHASCAALLARRPEARLLVAYEFREEWESVGMFLHWCSEGGLEETHLRIGEDGDEESDDDGDMFLYTLRWRDGALAPA